MNKKMLFGFFIILGAAILTSAAIIFVPLQSYLRSGPEEVVVGFYEAYLGYEGNPLVDKFYLGSTYLSPEFISFLDEFTSNGMMYDPILCAQDKPGSINIAEVSEEGGRAFVTVHTTFERHAFEVELVLDGNTWLIDQVNCQ